MGTGVFAPPPFVQERVKYLFYLTFDDRHIGCLDKFQKWVLQCILLYAYLAEVYSCLQVCFIIFKRIDHSYLRFKDFCEKFL